MDLKKKMLKRAYRFTNENKDKVYYIYSILNDLNKFKNLNCWDAKGSNGDFDRWCDQKGYGQKDPEGKTRGGSNIWFAQQQKEIKEGKWIRPEYCPFVDMFMDYHEIMKPEVYLSGDEYEELDFDTLLEKSRAKDIEQYGKEDYRTHLATELKNLFEDPIYIMAGED